MKNKLHIRKELGNYLVDISKLVFGGVVLSQVLGMTENRVIIFVAGILSTIFLAILGFIVLNFEGKE